jgi:hypothetical protein
MQLDPYILVALVQDRVQSRLISAVNDRPPGSLTLGATADDNLLTQLLGDVVLPRGFKTDQLQGAGLLDLAGLLPEGSGPLALLDSLVNDARAGIRRILASRNWDDVLAASRELFAGQLATLGETIVPTFAGQVGIVISLATTLANLPRGGPDVEKALLRYLFTPTGFETVDGTQIVAPVHLGAIDVTDGGHLKALFSERTGERYVRDLIRLIVEAADDVRFDLASRLRAQREILGPEKSKKLDLWFKGFASLAESATMGAVEEAVLGVSQFQTNALIAASAGTFAGTAARKAAQHLFLKEMEFWGGQTHS